MVVIAPPSLDPNARFPAAVENSLRAAREIQFLRIVIDGPHAKKPRSSSTDPIEPSKPLAITPTITEITDAASIHEADTTLQGGAHVGGTGHTSTE